MSEKISASRIARLLQCQGSAHLELSIPGWVPPVVDENKGQRGVGHRLHAVMENLGSLPLAEMRAVLAALQYVVELRGRRRFTALTEATVVADWLVTNPQTTVDLVLYTADELHVVDYKFGKIPVSAVDNEQLMYYALCFAHLAPKAKEVTIHVVQPLINHIEAFVVTTAELAKFMDRVVAAEKLILAGSTVLSPGDACTFCPANPHSRTDKGRPMCPPMMRLHYPLVVDEAEMLAD